MPQILGVFILIAAWVLILTACFRVELFGSKLTRTFVNKIKSNTNVVSRSGDKVTFRSRTDKTAVVQFFTDNPGSGIYKITINGYDSNFEFNERRFIAWKLKKMLPRSPFELALSEY